MAEAIPPLPPLLPPVIQQPPPLLQPPVDKSGMLLFYRCWCGFFVLIYVGMAVHSILIARGSVEPPLGLIESAVSAGSPPLRDEIFAEKRAKAPEFAGFTFAIALVYVAAACIPRKPWAWTFGLVIICTTFFPFIVTLGGMIPLLIQWVSPAGKIYFGKQS
jgi:hypothetical protein